MSLKATLDRQAIRRFNAYHAHLMEDFPETRALAVRTMGESVKRDLDAQIGSADLETDAKGTVRSWQEVRLGSRGGYAALAPQKATPLRAGRKPKSWRGEAVTVKQITKWLELGHGVRKPGPDSKRKSRFGRSGVNRSTGVRYVKARMFYSWTKMKALEHAIDAANEALERFAEGKGV